jgi:hypothetical protein
MDTSNRARVKAVSQWEVIRAARAFYGRPLDVGDIQKVKAAFSANKRRPRRGQDAPTATLAAPPRAMLPLT